MNKLRKNSVLYPISIFICAMTVFIVILMTLPPGFPDIWPELLLSTSIIIWLAHHRLVFEQDQTSLIHALTLTLGISIGIAPALIALSLGILIYACIDFYRKRRYLTARPLRIRLVIQWLITWSRQVLSNTCGLSIYYWLGGTSVSGAISLPSFWPFLGSITGFSLVYLGLHWLSPFKTRRRLANRRETFALITTTLAPAPIVLLATTGYSILGTASYVIYCIAIAVAAPIFSSLTRMERQLRQRSEALGLLSGLTGSITATLDPEKIKNLILESSTQIGCGDQAHIYVYANSDPTLKKTLRFNLTSKVESHWIKYVESSVESDISANQFIIFDNIAEANFPDSLRMSMQHEHIVSMASLPLQTSQDILGRLTIFSTQPIRYSERRRELLNLFSSQAAFALSNAQAHASADQKLTLQTQQLSRLEEINRQLTASSASDNLHEIILDHAMQATNAEWGYLALHIPGTEILQFAAFQGTGTVSSEEYPQFNILDGIFGRAFTTGQVWNIPDTSKELEYIDPLRTQASSVLCVPVCGPDAMLGVIGVEASRTHAFSAAHEQFLLQLSAYAANALFHSRTYQELQDRLTELSLLYQASTQIAESLETDAVGMAIADSLRVAINADVASVYRWSEADHGLYLLARLAEGKPSIKGGQTTPDVTKLLGHAQCIKDRVHMQWSSDEEVSAQEKNYLQDVYGEGRILLLPLSIGERTLGIVEIFRQEKNPFSENAIRSAQSIAIQATIALENTDLFQRISESHNRLLAVLNSTREGILLIDTEGRVSIANRQIELMTGLKATDLLRSTIDDETLDLASRLGYTQLELDQLGNSLRDGHAQLTGIATFTRTDVPGKTYQRIDAPVYDRADQLIGWLISLRDITEQKEIEETREQLTEMIVHDLRSPLTAILNSLTLLRRDVDDETLSSIAEQAFAVSDRSVNQMLGLVNSLLDISRLESGKMKITQEDVPIDPLIQELQERFQLEANTIGVIFKTETKNSNVNCYFDREKIQRVLANLLDNAIKFTPAGGEIELGFSSGEGEVIFWVADSGPGISPEFHEKIFERYSQIPSTKGRRRGTGLGLAFAKLAVEAHKGKIWFEEKPGGGSIFKFSLPHIMQS